MRLSHLLTHKIHSTLNHTYSSYRRIHFNLSFNLNISPTLFSSFLSQHCHSQHTATRPQLSLHSHQPCTPPTQLHHPTISFTTRQFANPFLFFIYHPSSHQSIAINISIKLNGKCQAILECQMSAASRLRPWWRSTKLEAQLEAMALLLHQ